ncbi:MAG: PAS domain S-box protein [Bryobacteraceae bacterium]
MISVAKRSPIPDEVLFDQVHDAITATDVNGFLHTWNPGAERLYGYSASEVIGQHVQILLFPEERSGLLERVILPALRDGQFDGIVRNRKKDGSEIYIALRLRAMHDRNGYVEHILGCANDVTRYKNVDDALRLEVEERQRVQSTLEASEARFRHLLAQSPAVIYSCKASGDFGGTFVSENVERLFGYPAANYLTIPGFWVNHIHPGDRKCVFDKLDEQLKTGRTLIEYRYLHADGSYRWVRDSAVLIRDGAGEHVELVGHMMDVTTERAARQTQREHERLQFFSEALLTAQEEERKRISRELHDDLNQRLAALIVELGVMEKKPPSSMEANRRSCAFLKEQIAEVSDQVRQIALQLHSAGLEQFGLAVALRHEFMGVTSRTGLQVHFMTSGLPERLPNNISLCLYRVAQECIRNVVKHSNVRQAEVTLDGSNPGWIRLRINDSGNGFDPKQARNRMTLGLISMNERLRQVNGTLTIESKEGGGTRVEASVPYEHTPVVENQGIVNEENDGFVGG